MEEVIATTNQKINSSIVRCSTIIPTTKLYTQVEYLIILIISSSNCSYSYFANAPNFPIALGNVGLQFLRIWLLFDALLFLTVYTQMHVLHYNIILPRSQIFRQFLVIDSNISVASIAHGGKYVSHTPPPLLTPFSGPTVNREKCRHQCMPK